MFRYEQACDEVAAQNEKYIDADISASHHTRKAGMRKKDRYNGQCAQPVEPGNPKMLRLIHDLFRSVRRTIALRG